MASGRSRRHILISALVGALSVLAAFQTWGGGLRFDQPAYVVFLGQDLQVEVRLDLDSDLPGDQVPAEGLFSAGVSATFEASAANAGSVTLPEDFDNSSAQISVGAGYVGAAGAVDFFLATNGYSGATILTFNLAHAVPGSYTLTPGLFYTAPRENFVDYGTGAVLDDQITNFVASTVLVVAPHSITSATLSAADTMTVTCQLPSNAVPATIILEEADPMLDAGSWAAVPSIPVTPSAPGFYEATMPLGSAASRLYRITTTW